MQDKEPIIEFKDIHKAYDGKPVHQGVDLTIYKGEILTLMGGSGSGKSVLLRALIGIDRPDKGTIIFKGQEVTGLLEEELVEVRKKIAYVFQNGALFDSLTVEENLAYPLEEHTKLSKKEIHEKVISTLRKIGLEGSESILPAELSGGMQKRVGVARSIIMDPEVILYDEPTSGLDPYNTRQILRIVRQLKHQGATSILVTHDMNSLFTITDRIAFLRHGKIAALGTAEEIKHTKNPEVRGFIHGEKI